MASSVQEQGARVIDRPASRYTAAELHCLADGAGIGLTAATHESCFVHAAYVGQEHLWGTVDADGLPLPPPTTRTRPRTPTQRRRGRGKARRREWTGRSAPRWV